MLKRIGTLAAAILGFAACSNSSPTGPTVGLRPGDSAPSFAEHTTPGTPGDPNCRGQTTAFVAQAAKNEVEEGLEGFRGIGGIARVEERTVQEEHAIVETFCATP